MLKNVAIAAVMVCLVLGIVACGGQKAPCLFDTGLQTAFLILRATELGLVAHPVAGYSPKAVRGVLDIPDTMQVIITLVNIGKHAETISPVLSEKQVRDETQRPERLPLEQVAFFNHWPGEE
jgi:hypothetical protein